ncbi:MAG: FemAB family XrtA/PEP-CTERM system-associated protein [Blastocatellia bacterium]
MRKWRKWIDPGFAVDPAGSVVFAGSVPSRGHDRVTVRTYSRADAAAWDEYTYRTEAATFCHLSGWMRVVENTWRHAVRSLIAERNGRIAGVLPLCHLNSRWLGPLSASMLVSTPNAVYGGAVADDEDARTSLIEAAKSLAVDLRVDHLELRDPARTPAPAPGLLDQNLYVAFEHPISTDEDALMKSFPRDVRRMIRQGPKHGLESVRGRQEFLDDFYEVYATSVRNLGTPVFPKKLFAGFLREFPESSDILVIKQKGRVAAAVLNFYFRDTVMPYYGGAYPEFYRTGVNNFMYWELMRSAASRGYTRFDFGRSKLGTGACEFKRGWGMAERQLAYKFFLVRAKEMPNLNPLNPKFKLMIEAWKRLPLSVTKLIGPRVVRNLP